MNIKLGPLSVYRVGFGFGQTERVKRTFQK